MMSKMMPILSIGLSLTIMAATGCSGDSNVNPVEPVSASVDTAPPVVPTGLSASTGSSVVKLSWDPNTLNTDFEGFLVYRLVLGQTFLLTALPIQETVFVDSRPLDISCGYAVSSIDRAGNESAVFEIQYVAEPVKPEIGSSFTDNR